MKNPWDSDDDGTIIIRNDEVTEIHRPTSSKRNPLEKLKEGLKVFRKDSPSKENGSPPKSKTQASKEEAFDAIDETISKITGFEGEEISSSFEASELTTPKGSNLGEILIATTKLTETQLREALDIRKEQGDESTEMLGDILVRKKMITEDELLSALSLQLNIPVVHELLKQEIQNDLATKIPINFAKKHGLIPIRMENGRAMVAISNTVDLSSLDDVRMLLRCDVSPYLARKQEIVDIINRVYDRATNQDQELMEDLEEAGGGDLPEPQDLLDSEDEAPIIRLVNTLLFRAVKDRASDIHIEPFEKELSVRFRIDGVLYEIMKPPKRTQASISSRIKIMADLDIAEKRIPQDGRIKIKLAGRDVDIRVSTLPTSFGERIVMRLLDTSNVILDLEDIGFSERQLAVMNKIIHKPHGIFLVTGPTGSGKTTTLYAALSRINSRERNIITVEDPVEIQLSGIGQIQVNPKVNLTFASGLRSILRQDPDVIMVGEIRDLETAEIAIQASLTGHFVFSTLHTNDATSTLTRLVDMGVEPFLVASSLVAVMAQRLVRVVCPSCREPYQPTESELKELGISAERASLGNFYRPVGCAECWNTGYKGRTGIYEILPIDEELRSIISKNSDAGEIKKVALRKGLKTLRDDGADKILRGITTVEEVLRVTQEEMVVE